MRKIIIPGQPVSKKNSRRLFVRKERIMNIPSDAYRSWHKIATTNMIGVRPITSPFFILCRIYRKTDRVFDNSNAFEGIADLLVDCRILEDDNYRCLLSFIPLTPEKDKHNPRSELFIFEGTECVEIFRTLATAEPQAIADALTGLNHEKAKD